MLLNIGGAGVRVRERARESCEIRAKSIKAENFHWNQPTIAGEISINEAKKCIAQALVNVDREYICKKDGVSWEKQEYNQYKRRTILNGTR